MSLYRSNTARLLIALLAVSTTGCVSAGRGTVKISPVEANLVFGAKKLDEATPLASDQNPDIVPDIAAELTLPPPLPGLDLQPRAKVTDCPEAALTAGSEKAADVTITGEPLVGIARWKHSGTLQLNGKAVPFSGFERRVVRNYVQVSPTVFTFETLQPIVTNRGTLFLDSSFRVRTDGLSKAVTSPGQGVPSPPAIHEPDGGVVLTSIKTIDSSGGTIGTAFTPVTGILLLPLPVIPDDSWRSVAVDPKSGQTVTHNATVDRRQRIDACGDLVDGWHVTATQVVASGRDANPQVAYNGYDYVVATQYGGMIIDERLTQPDPAGQTPSPFDLDFSLGQLHPDPIPAG